MLPNWFSRVEAGEGTYINDDMEVRSYRSPQTLRVGKYCSIGACLVMGGDADHDPSFA